MNGFLSTRELEERWGAKWRRNNPGLKTENGRCKKVIQLVEELSKNQDGLSSLHFIFYKTDMEVLLKALTSCHCQYCSALDSHFTAFDECFVI